MSDRFVVLSGCSGGGKSTLLAELRRRGCATVDEPGRRVVKEEVAEEERPSHGSISQPSRGAQSNSRWQTGRGRGIDPVESSSTAA